MKSRNLDEIRSVESDRELFTSATQTSCLLDLEKLRQAQHAEFGPYLEYLGISIGPEETTAIKRVKSRTSMLYYSIVVKTGAFYIIGVISPAIFVKEVRSAINL